MAPLPIITTFRLQEQGSQIPILSLVALIQARIRNPSTPIYVLTDQTDIPEKATLPILQTIEFVSSESLIHSAKYFREIYFHLSEVSFFYEQTCIERWFLVNEFAKQRDIPRFFHMDSDVLLFCDIEEAAQRFQGSDATTTSDGCWSTAFFLNQEVLSEYCSMITELYERKTYLWQKAMYALGLTDPKRKVDNISDMFLIGLYKDEIAPANNRKIVPCDAPIHGRFFDPHVNTSRPGVEMENGVKKIFWSQGIPYAKRKNRDEYLRMDCMHFQGNAKHLLIPTFDHSVKTVQQINSEIEDKIFFGDSQSSV